MPEHDNTITRRAAESMGDRIRRQRKVLHLSQIELARQAGLNQGYLSQIERDRAQPSRRTLEALAATLSMPVGVLIGGGVDHDSPQPLETRRLPLFGTVPAGPPSQSQEAVEFFPILRHLWSPDHYCLKLAFDSMEPTLKPGDIVLVHYRPGVEPEHVQGRICACLINGQATLKRVSVDSHADRPVVILRGDNPRIPPMLITPDREFSIQGIVVRLVSRDL